MRPAGPGDDQARFLADLRALRDTAAIGFEELAARAHYPSDLLKEAENGPRLPSLPVLAAYVRACEGNVTEWEERWRRLGDETRADPNLPVRAAGASPAAMAGARAGIGVAPPEAYNPERIRAALRGSPSRPADDMRPADGPGVTDTGTGLRTFDTDRAGTFDTDRAGTFDTDRAGTFDTADRAGTFDTADRAGTFDTADRLGTFEAADPGAGGIHRAEGWAGEAAGRAWTVREDQFSASWRQDREPASRAGNGTSPWLEPTPQTPQTVPSSPATQTPQASPALQTPQASPALHASPSSPTLPTSQVSQAPSASPAPQAPQAPQIPKATWTLGDALAAEPGSGGQTGRTRTGVDLAQGTGTASAAAAQPRGSAESAGPAVIAAASHRNRAFSWQLVALIIVAALLGSVLMMVFR